MPFRVVELVTLGVHPTIHWVTRCLIRWLIIWLKDNIFGPMNAESLRVKLWVHPYPTYIIGGYKSHYDSLIYLTSFYETRRDCLKVMVVIVLGPLYFKHQVPMLGFPSQHFIIICSIDHFPYYALLYFLDNFNFSRTISLDLTLGRLST